MKIMNRKNVGAIGIGAMIVFIAMVLVAGIAASVLIQTSSRLESQAMATGEQTTAEVSGGIAVDDVAGHVASGSDIDMLAITVRVRAGSPAIDLNHTVIELSDGTKKVILSYDYSNPTHFNSSLDSDAQIFGTGNISTLTNEQFGIIVLEDSDGSCSSRYTPVINRGDRVFLTVNVGNSTGFNKLGERTDVWGMVVPEEGAPGVISFRTPAAYTETVYELQ